MVIRTGVEYLANLLLEFNALQIIRTTGYELDDREVRVRVPAGSRLALGYTQPLIQ